MTNVPTSSQTRPPGLAITSAQQAPGECLRVSVAGKELFSATFQTGWRSVGAGSSFRAAGGSRCLPTPPGTSVCAATRGLPLPCPLLSRALLPPRRHPQGSAHPRDGRQGRARAAQGRRDARLLPSCRALAAASWTDRPSKAFFAHQPFISTLGMTSARDCQPRGLFYYCYYYYFFPPFPGFLLYKQHLQLLPLWSGH